MLGKSNRSACLICGTSLLRKPFCAWLRDGCGHEFCGGNAMVSSLRTRTVANLGIASALALFLGACGSYSLPSLSSPTAAPEPSVAPELPATIRPDEIVGRWGLASYQNPNDRARSQVAVQAALRHRKRIRWGRDDASGRPGHTSGTAP